MRRNIKLLTIFVFLFVIAIACSNDDDTTATVQFKTLSTSVAEDEGTIEIEIASTKAVATNQQISFELSGSAALNGDYQLVTNSPVTMAAGTSSTTIQLKLIDERIIEEDDEIKITLTGVGSGAILSANSGSISHVITIQDNDFAEDGKLQLDLTWDIGEGKDIYNANFDLYLAKDVLIENNVVTDATLYSDSESSSGFETLWLSEDDEDDEYYIVVYYSEGDVDGEFKVNLNGMGFGNQEMAGDFTTDDVGYAIFYGPIYKSGSSIGRSRVSAPISIPGENTFRLP